MSQHLPENYAAWRHCIEVDCAQPLTADFIAQRLAALHDPADHHTQQFLRRWGQAHHQQVIVWLERAQAAQNTH
ncbi:hypothetical protein KWH19_19230 [Xanthomonas campestris pv. pennamericanum]|uniref:hypothetical protein n=1 Tax=Xanthomonas euvesicatoria TaxID=456327 RepID=UPI001C443445|nr:hypothetical protein [Xanthomonas euvesicatoria]MBV6811841.1 hypothetical protein [Xanthomonas campestris pv. pennamericanum]